MSLLPGQIMPATAPLGYVVNALGQRTGDTVAIEQNYWLLLYNLCLQVLGVGATGLPADALQDLASADSDAIDSDAIALRAPLASALLQSQADVMVGLDDLPDLQRALLLAQDALLQDPAPRAQPAQGVSPTGSPFTYTAAFGGTLVITGGVVSAIAVIRQGMSVAVGITTGLVPLSRSDQVQVTYSSAPTMTFLPT